jgi:protein TonB
MRHIPFILCTLILASCARDKSAPPEVAQELAKFDAEFKKSRETLEAASQKLPPDRTDFRGETAQKDIARWVLPASTIETIESHRKTAVKAKFVQDAEAALVPARTLLVAELARFSAISRYWMSALPSPFWRGYWNSLYESNGLAVKPPDSMLVSIESDMKAALERGDFLAASTKAEEMVPVLEAAIDSATSRLVREVGPPTFSARKTPCPRGVAPDAGQSKPALVDSKPVNDFYPPGAIARGETGSLVLRARVDSQGCANQFAIVVRSGVKSLNDAALVWFETARYSPATRGGRAVDAEHTFKVKFVLR